MELDLAGRQAVALRPPPLHEVLRLSPCFDLYNFALLGSSG